MSALDNNKKKGPSPPSSIGQAGVILKQFEAVLTKILMQNQNTNEQEHISISSTSENDIKTIENTKVFQLPRYVKLPPLLQNSSLDSTSDLDDNNWPFNILPPAACICGKPERVWKKEAQIRCMVKCVLNMLPDDFRIPTKSDTGSSSSRRLKIVDFGGGGGNLALPLAVLLPHCDIVIVDLKDVSLSLARRRAALCHDELLKNIIGKASDEHLSTQYNEKMVRYLYRVSGKAETIVPKNVEVSCEGLTNLKLFHGDIRSFQSKFDLGLALHACGEATDLAMDKCCMSQAAFIVAPCCVGKLNRNKSNPIDHKIIEHDMGSINTRSSNRTEYPRSELFQSRLNIDTKEFDRLASAGDYGIAVDMRTSRGAFRRAAKTLLEFDRMSWAQESGYQTALTRMQPWEASPKNDIIIGWLSSSSVKEQGSLQNDVCSPFRDDNILCIPCNDSNRDLEIARHHLLGQSASQITDVVQTENISQWADHEIYEIEQTLSQFIVDANKAMVSTSETSLESPSSQTLTFPTGLGSKKRKLVHHLAETLGLKHWSIGGRSNQHRSVVVAIKRNMQS